MKLPILLAIHLEFSWLVPMDFAIQCIFTEFAWRWTFPIDCFSLSRSVSLSNTVQTFVHLPERQVQSVWVICFLYLVPVLVLVLDLVQCVSIAYSNWFTFCSFARHFQCGCFIWIVLSVIAHTVCYMCCSCFAYVSIHFIDIVCM